MSYINAFSANSTSANWMVTRLFGGTAAKQSNSIGSLVASLEQTKSASSSKSDQATDGGASVSLPSSQGTPTTSSVADSDSNGLLSARQDQAIEDEANAESSESLSDGLYGPGVTVAGAVGQTRNFADILADENAQVASLTSMANDPTLSASARATDLSLSQSLSSLVDSETTAYDNHTLTFQKATDVAGLDYQGGGSTFEGAGGDDDNAPVAAYSKTSSYNSDFMSNNPDGKNHTTMDVGNGVMMYLTW